MSTIESPVKTICNLRFHPIRSGVTNIEKVSSNANGILLLGKNGKLYCPGLRARACYTPSVYHFTVSLLKNLVKMKIITKDEMDQHIEFCEKRDKDRTKAHDLWNLKRMSEVHGFKIPKSVENKLT